MARLPAGLALPPTDPLHALVDLPQVAEAIVIARQEMDRLLGQRVLHTASAEVSTESAVRGAWASAALEGVEIPLEELKAAVASGTTPDDPVMQGALRVSAGLGGLVDTWRRAPRQALARLHLLAAAGLTDPSEVGKPGRGGLEPAQEARLSALVGLLAAGTRAPAVVLAAIVHGELLDLAPFAVGNGVVARAAARLTLIAHGLDPKGVSVPEVGHRELAAAYGSALAAYATGSREGVARWIVHCSEAVRLGAREGLAICQAVTRG